MGQGKPNQAAFAVQSNRELEEWTVAQEIVVAGHRKLAQERHPDTGGSSEAFDLLTRAKEKLVNVIEEKLDYFADTVKDTV